MARSHLGEGENVRTRPDSDGQGQGRKKIVNRFMRPAIMVAAMLAGCGLAGVLQAADGPAQYTGPGSCSSSSCHGGVQPRSDTSVLQNEYSTWAVQDKHTRALAVLSNDVA